MLCRHVHFVIFPGINLLDLTGPLQVFSTANELMEQAGHPVPYRISVIATKEGMVSTTAGLPITATALPAASSPADTLVVTGGPGITNALQDQTLLSWLTANAAHSRRVVSICSGAFLLAACGLLNGRRAVTHWSVCSELAQQYPQVQVEHDPIFIQDDQFWTSAGVTAGIDLALALVSDDLGHQLALKAAQNLVVFLKRPGGQAQFSTTLAFQRKTARFSDLHAWIADNLTADLSVATLATRVNMSERSFIRHYRQETGITPAKAIEQLRLEAARQLLVETNFPIKRIAERCGFNGETTLRRRFLACYGNTPSDFRRCFA